MKNISINTTKCVQYLYIKKKKNYQILMNKIKELNKFHVHGQEDSILSRPQFCLH